MMEEMSIGEAAKRAGVNTSTIRYYERIGLLPKSRRVNKHRRYDESILQSLAVINFAQRAGYTLAEINRLFHDFAPDTPPAERWQSFAQFKLTELDAMIARAQEMKRLLESTENCRCARLEDCAVMVGAGANPDATARSMCNPNTSSSEGL
jgi:MerR family redox-sensitive transcriptional activator SoxR